MVSEKVKKNRKLAILKYFIVSRCINMDQYVLQNLEPTENVFFQICVFIA